MNWKFEDADGDTESASRFAWSILDPVDDAERTVIPDANSASLPVVPEAAINQRIQACVTPQTDATFTWPSSGEPACLVSMVAPPSPAASSLAIAVKEADGLYTVNNTLTGSYLYTGIGMDVSRTIFAPHGQAKNKLLAGEGAVSSPGEVADFPLTGLAGRKVELGVLPLSHYGGKGDVVVLQSDEYIYDPTLPPILGSFTATIHNGGNALVAVPYSLDRAGGAAGDKSTYRLVIGGTQVNSGDTDWNNSVIPAQTVPAGIYGGIEYFLTPRNSSNIVNAEIKLDGVFGEVMNQAAVPSISNIAVTWDGAPASPAVGTVLNGTYDYTIGPGGTPGHLVRYAYRIYRADSQNDKKNWINEYYGNNGMPNEKVTSTLIIPPFTVPPQWAGEELELITWVRSNYGIDANDVQSVKIPSVSGSQPMPSDVNAKPSIDVTALAGTGFLKTWEAWGVSNIRGVTNGGYPIKEFKVSVVGKRRNTGAVLRFGPYVTQLDSFTFSNNSFEDDYISIELQAVNTANILSDKIVVGMDALGMGPGGSGYYYNYFVVTPNGGAIPLSFKLNDNGISEGLLRPGKLLSASYTFSPTPGTADVTTYSWNSGVPKQVSKPGDIPAYRIQESDIGKVVSLVVEYKEDDGRGYSGTSSPITKSTEGFEGGVVLERETASVPGAFELLHNNLGYTYLQGGDGPTTSDAGSLHSWGSADVGCTRKGSGWRLPTAAELLAISGSFATRPSSWPAGHTYWTSEIDGTGQHKTVYMATSSVGQMPDGQWTAAVCVSTASAR
ncbi:hypothetical protein [Aeromonas jandaei]|uniref:hypothetical protein n=1 Tax=Aeromonas jandaei TaxID=650 RepID=UPI003EC789C8